MIEELNTDVEEAFLFLQTPANIYVNLPEPIIHANNEYSSYIETFKARYPYIPVNSICPCPDHDSKLRMLEHFLEADFTRVLGQSFANGCDSINMFRFIIKDKSEGEQLINQLHQMEGPGLVWFKHFRFNEDSDTFTFYICCIAIYEQMECDQFPGVIENINQDIEVEEAFHHFSITGLSIQSSNAQPGDDLSDYYSALSELQSLYP